LAAVGQEGFRRLAARVREDGVEGLPALETLRETLLAYMRFSVEEKDFFRLMIANLLKRPLRADETEELKPFPFSSPEALASFSELVAVVKRCQTEGSLGPGDSLFIANLLHAFVHGVARLAIDDHLKIACPEDEFFRQGLDAVLRGLGAASAGSRHWKLRTTPGAARQPR